MGLYFNIALFTKNNMISDKVVNIINRYVRTFNYVTNKGTLWVDAEMITKRTKDSTDMIMQVDKIYYYRVIVSDNLGNTSISPIVSVNYKNKKEGKPTSADLLEEMVDKSKKVVILNPEPKLKWNVVDSAVKEYQDAGAIVKEVRNLRQLAELIEYL